MTMAMWYCVIVLTALSRVKCGLFTCRLLCWCTDENSECGSSAVPKRRSRPTRRCED